ncbi:hypothetical protein ACFSL6_11845 [Paenibacillus thailandensis]|uniref:Uncharacterized protein n=1 Tax=Paenibacillus thailandensis TaxID=393250 RepID=A0ABW5R0I5_9BACL
MKRGNSKIEIDLRKVLEQMGFRHLSSLPHEQLAEIIFKSSVIEDKDSICPMNKGGVLKD